MNEGAAKSRLRHGDVTVTLRIRLIKSRETRQTWHYGETEGPRSAQTDRHPVVRSVSRPPAVGKQTSPSVGADPPSNRPIDRHNVPRHGEIKERRHTSSVTISTAVTRQTQTDCTSAGAWAGTLAS